VTGWLLLCLARVRGPWWAQLLLATCALAVAPMALFLDAVGVFLREWRIVGALGQTETRCPRGHMVVLSGPSAAWTCSSCAYTYGGASGWGRCPRCRSVAAYVSCPCGLSIDNPVFELVDDAR